MSELSYKALQELLDEIKSGTICSVYLLYGDEFIYRSAFKSLLDVLVPPRHQDLNYEAVDGEDENVYEIIRRLKTFPLIPSSKVIAVHGTKVFYSAVVMDDLFCKSKEAFETQDFEESARYLLSMLSMAGMALDDVRDGNWQRVSDRKLKERFAESFTTGELEGKKDDHGGWLDQVSAYCLEKNMTVPEHQDDADILNDAILTGYPETNHLILMTELVDKRRKLYKTIKRVGVAIDCSVPKGDRKADRDQQQAALKRHTNEILRKAGKTMVSGGFESLYEKVGADMPSFASELEKVVTFVGDRDMVSPSDVDAVSKRIKQDPIYEISNAIAARNANTALFFLGSLLKSNAHPLQVLAVVTNQIRKLILAKDFTQSKYGKSWRKDLSFAGFKKMILPGLEKREPDLLTSNVHPYPLYKTLQQSHNYTLEELIAALQLLLETDIRLKSSSQNAKMVLEHAVLGICRA